ncbi:MAG: zinc-ribbon domain-containing protein [Acholeplasmatales bacterium]|jgi:hypothetical protein|nr:zinc-ribbon domain-containing protein [Acholeplasmatales bacterium]
MIKCQNCGKENSNEAKFCSDCGKTLERYCKNCGNKVEESSVFCPKCGTKLASSNAVVVPIPEKVIVNPEIKAKKVKKVLTIIAMASVFTALFMILMAFFLDWIAIGPRIDIFSNIATVPTLGLTNGYSDLYYQLGANNVGTNFISIINVIVSYINWFSRSMPSNLSDTRIIVSQYVAFGSILGSLIITSIVQIVVAIIWLVGTIKIIILVCHKKEFIKFSIKIAIGILIPTLICAMVVGSVDDGIVIVLSFSLMLIFILQVFDLIIDPAKPKIKTIIPNFVGSGALLVAIIVAVGLSQYTFHIGNNNATLTGLTKYLYFGVYSSHLDTTYVFSPLDIEMYILSGINLLLFLMILSLMATYVVLRFKNLFINNKKSNKIIGWILLGLVFVYSITNLITKICLNNIYSGYNIAFGNSIPFMVFMLINMVLGQINIKSPSKEVQVLRPSE